jgi:N-acetylglucosaminyldiphosphoundecaprenol N-acetyl-beta-D-mannosaminyltransferase
MAKRGCGRFVCVANVHMLVTARRDAKLRQVLERAAIVVSDGMPLVRRLRASGFPEAGQVRGPDLMMEVCRRAAEEGLPVYFFGGDDALMAKLKAALVPRLPELRMAGCEAAPMLPMQPAIRQTIR